MVLTRGTRMILTPTYHVFEFYTVHQDALLLPMTVVDAGKYVFNGDSVPAVSATASRDAHGVVHLTMSNLDPNRERTAVVELHGVQATSATGRVPKSVIVLELR